jgi:hypothetical protein
MQLAESWVQTRSEQLASNLDSGACAYVRTEILGYLATQPGAFDTLEGIVRWWIFDQRRRIARDVVEQALDELVRWGAVERMNRADGSILYRAAAVSPFSAP